VGPLCIADLNPSANVTITSRRIRGRGFMAFFD
jgi:hypothetical protein